jgi:ABC-type sugar transport system permease subunit
MDQPGSLVAAGAGAAAAAAGPQRRGLGRESLGAYLFLAPAVTVLATFLIGPAIWIFWLSLFKWNLIEAEPTYVGLSNYDRLIFRDDEFHKAVFNTVYYVAISVPVGILLGLLFAVLLSARIRGRGLMRGIIFSPHIMPFVATITVWAWMFNPEYGILNATLSLVHIAPLKWLRDPATFMPSFIIYSLWSHVGYNTVIFLAGLANLPPDVDEAARVDGANAWQVFWRVKWPMLSPTTYLVVLINLIGAFKIAQQILVITGGTPGPNYAALTIGLQLYREAFVKFHAGYAGAISVILFVIILAISAVQVGFFSRRVFYQ